MAINFPSSPTNGQVFYALGRTYTYNSTTLVWVAGTSVTNYYAEGVYTGGATTGTITPDVAFGSIQAITLTGAITLNAFANPIAGQSLTLLVTQPSSGNVTLSSTMLFAGGSKALSTTVNALDVITVMYTGSVYIASLSKGHV